MGSAVISEVAPLESETFTDEELADQALAADPEVELAADALCLWDVIGPREAGDPKLPEWYMPAPMTGARPVRRRWHRGLALLIILSFVVIDGLGLCITYGQLVVA
jgi:hypothetical protein